MQMVAISQVLQAKAGMQSTKSDDADASEMVLGTNKMTRITLPADLVERLQSADPHVMSSNAFDLLHVCAMPESAEQLARDPTDEEDDTGYLTPLLVLAPVTESKKRKRGASDIDTVRVQLPNGSSCMVDGGGSMLDQEAGSLHEQKKAFAAAWLSVIKLPLSKLLYRRLLLKLPEDILPQVPEPLMWSDFLSDSYRIGGAVGVLALQSLFILITRYNLDYPEFYQKLYSMICPEVLCAKYRARFFSLLDLCMASIALPAYLVAAVAKKLLRLCLTSPAPVVVFTLPMVYNLLRRHPACAGLIHRGDPEKPDLRTAIQRARDIAAEIRLRKFGMTPNMAVEAFGNVPAVIAPTSAAAKEAPTAGGQDNAEQLPDSNKWRTDPFNSKDPNPETCGALESSLWELLSLKRHYHPVAARLAQAVEGGLKKPAFTIEEFTAHTYSSMVEADLARGENRTDNKAKLPLQHIRPTGLFGTGKQARELPVAAAEPADGSGDDLEADRIPDITSHLNAVDPLSTVVLSAFDW